VKFLAWWGGNRVTILSSCAAVFSEGTVRMSLDGANRAPSIDGEEIQPGKVHYFQGSDPQQWLTNIPTYKKAKCSSVYPGIDLIYYVNGQRLEYDFVVAPGADPQNIGLRFDGVPNLHLAPNGDLAGDGFRVHKPAVYQELGGIRIPVSGTYRLLRGGRIGLLLGSYDPSRPLVIDPVVAFVRMDQSVGEDAAGVALDASGNIYLTGGSLCSAYVSKLDPSGSFLYRASIGGTSMNGECIDGFSSGAGIAVDAAGDAYITGSTDSLRFPTTANAFQRTSGETPDARGRILYDAFVTKLDSNGAIVYSTLLSGKSYDVGRSIAVDAAGSALVTGYTESHDFPTASAFQPDNRGARDVFVTKLDPAGSSLVYSTYLGGSGYDSGASISVDRSGNAYLTGQTGSLDFPIANAAQPASGGGVCYNARSCDDAFATKISPSGTLIYSTYFGGGDDDFGTAITSDADGNVYLAGLTQSLNFPTANAVQPAPGGCIVNGGWICADAFVTKLNASGQIVYSTYLGGSSFDAATAITVDPDGAASVSGVTASFDWPTRNPIQSNYVTYSDAFVAKLNKAGSALLFSSSLGSCFADASCRSTGAASTLVADRLGSLYIVESLYDATNIWGWPLTATVISKIDLAGRPVINARGIVNGASLRFGSLSPGEIVTIFGSGMGPFAAGGPKLGSDGLVATSLSGTRVLFNGMASPVLYASPNQVSAVVPYGAAGKSNTEVRLEFAGTMSDGVMMPVAGTAPGIFTVDASGTGGAFATNEDGSRNSPNHPASRGSTIVLYATGEGITNPAGLDGKPAEDPLPRPALPVSVQIGGMPAELLYAGGAAGQVAGLMQLKVRIPPNLAPGNATVEITVGGFASQPGVTIAVR
jgi:uncharacterized protein (TIGR03437 family)